MTPLSGPNNRETNVKPLRILIADDHDVVREGLRTLLAQHTGWEICGEAAGGREAVDKALKLKPDVVVLDFSLPELNGLDVTRRIRTALPQAEVLILTMHESETLAGELLAAGARAFVVKTHTRLQLIPALEALARHQPFFTPAVSALVLEKFLYPAPRGLREAAASERLTAREREIVQIIAEGRTSKEIASLLGVSVKTVDAHRANILRKLRVHSVSQLVLYAIRNHLVQA